MTPAFGPGRPPISLESVTRASVRALVEQDAAHMLEARRAGANVHQISLDRADQVNDFVQSLNELDQMTFLKLYHEEMSASNSAMMDQAKVLNAQAAARGAKQVTRTVQLSRALTIVVIAAIGILIMRMIMLR